MDERTKRFEKDIGEIKESVKAIDECIRGNGKVGMKTELDRCNQRWKNYDKWAKVRLGVYMVIFSALVYASVRGIVGLI